MGPRSTSPHVRLAGGAGYGYLWWTFAKSGHRIFAASGSEGQLIIVISDLDAVVVIASDVNGGTANPPTDPELSDEILKVVIPALKR
jgi:CubicO group peptidase (beta-lactamase class C family)